MWLRLTAAHLPADDLTTAFQDRHLLALGLKALAVEAILLLLIAAVVWLSWKGIRAIGSRLSHDEKDGADAEPSRPDQPASRLISLEEYEESRPAKKSADESILEVILTSISVSLSLLAVTTSIEGGQPTRTLVLLFAFLLVASLAVGSVWIFEALPEWISGMRAKPWVKRAGQALRWALTWGWQVSPSS